MSTPETSGVSDPLQSLLPDPDVRGFARDIAKFLSMIQPIEKFSVIEIADKKGKKKKSKMVIVMRDGRGLFERWGIKSELVGYYHKLGNEHRPRRWTHEYVEDLDFMDESGYWKMRSKLDTRLLREETIYRRPYGQLVRVTL